VQVSHYAQTTVYSTAKATSSSIAVVVMSW